MAFDYITLKLLLQKHPAWRLLRAQHAPLICSFLHRIFIIPNKRNLSQSELTEALEDELYIIREQPESESFSGTAQNYLNEWADNNKGWLRKFYPPDSDEPHFDLTPATEKAISWLENLTERSFVGTESRLLTLFELLRQMSEGSQTDPQIRITELKKRREEIDSEINSIKDGDISVLDDTGLKDRFQQFIQLARELLTDFREVEHNFRILDRHVRERIALWEGAKGELLEEIMGERDAISDSDQGKSFRAFWDFLMSQSRQEEFSRLLEQILSLPPIKSIHPEDRLKRVHYDWLEAGEHTQRTVAKLSEQLRRFLDDQAWLENRRIMDILHSIENNALAIREDLPSGNFVTVSDISPTIDLPLERPLFRPSLKPLISSMVLEEGDADVDTAALYAQVAIDRKKLKRNIRHELQARKAVSLAEIVTCYPLDHGLAELVAYLQLAVDWPHKSVNEDIKDKVTWQSDMGVTRQAILPRIIFMRN